MDVSHKCLWMYHIEDASIYGCVCLWILFSLHRLLFGFAVCGLWVVVWSLGYVSRVFGNLYLAARVAKFRQVFGEYFQKSSTLMLPKFVSSTTYSASTGPECRSAHTYTHKDVQKESCLKSRSQRKREREREREREELRE
jgi:hypothetical protein